MNENFNQHTPMWINFSYFSFAVALGMTAAGIIFSEIDIWVKAYLAMGLVMLLQTTVNLTKTLRDNAEAKRLIRKVEDAKTEKLLLDINRPDGGSAIAE
ncbi:YiaA/YiaB family inner membrane protein [Pseudovibrio sp. Alg231-02]|uniref:YiaA/YiaB family inner membrane protein n=1 Tax=Pseudovibrio sp. Alg231-02 TaxID=1922223 RepID=UPI000D55227E|nr:YiaA/YiaB family inner membrane protein [Pseudovibrio sp. Alg231-02]